MAWAAPQSASAGVTGESGRVGSERSSGVKVKVKVKVKMAARACGCDDHVLRAAGFLRVDGRLRLAIQWPSKPQQNKANGRGASERRANHASPNRDKLHVCLASPDACPSGPVLDG